MDSIIIPFSFIYFLDVIQFNLSSLFKVLGLGGWTFLVFGITYYIFGIILIILLVYVFNYELIGVWVSFIIVLGSVTIIYCIKYFMIDINKLAD
jgi:Na+-driven multidrug efflux pump